MACVFLLVFYITVYVLVYLILDESNKNDCLKTFAEQNSAAMSIPQSAIADIQSFFLSNNPLADELSIFLIPHLILQPTIDVIDGLDPLLSLFGSIMLFVCQVSAQCNMSTGNLVSRSDLNARILDLVKDVSSEMVICVVVSLDNSAGRHIRSNWSRRKGSLSRSWEKRKSKSREVV